MIYLDSRGGDFDMWCNVKLTEYRRGQPGASQRLSLFKRYIRVAPRPENPPVIPSTTKGGNQRDYKAESIARARRTISHLLRSADPARLKFITLTYAPAAAHTDPARALREIADLMANWRLVDADLAWVGTVERHESGYVHAHLIVSAEYIPQADLAALWARGYVWITALADTDTACRYLTKYLLKQDLDLPTSYCRSRNWPDTAETYWYAVRDPLALLASLEKSLNLEAYQADLAGGQTCWILSVDGDRFTRLLFGGGG